MKRLAPQTPKFGRSHSGVSLPPFIAPQLSKLVEAPPYGPQWLHEIKLDGYRWLRAWTTAEYGCSPAPASTGATGIQA
jgi:ATP-dependent DNA ligase